MNWSSNENIKLIYRLLRVKGYGPVQVNKLLFANNSSTSNTDELEERIKRGLTPSENEEFSRDFELYQDESGAVSYMSIMDDSIYPKELLNLLSRRAPSILSYMGNIALLRKKKIAFSGSRRASEKGLWITKDCIDQLASINDICIVSGYAAGIDTIAHYEALTKGASTIIILPEGISHFTIRKELKPVWDWSRVLVISEFFPSDKWLEGRAMQRNHTIIGISDAVVVVEAGETGGSMATGVETLKAGKMLYVPKYASAPESALGNERLLHNGAHPLARSPKTHRTNLEKMISVLNNHNGQHTLFE